MCVTAKFHMPSSACFITYAHRTWKYRLFRTAVTFFYYTLQKHNFKSWIFSYDIKENYLNKYNFVTLVSFAPHNLASALLGLSSNG